ncbi:asparagine synthase-related protein [Hyphomonas adhaerens]|uniref:asparagine synthase-related protein n=1 Tax=Hyphomonas adhaerens TaxID=81029 RepID=UPI002356E4E3|nr:asparagine synthase-related protein [Hyphomonas adhaerens]
MRAFFAMLWNPEDPAVQTSAARIRARFDEDLRHKPRLIEAAGLVLADLSLDQKTSPLVAVETAGAGCGSAAIFGTLFQPPVNDQPASRLPKLDGLAAGRFLRSGGRSLLADAWGSYVALVSDGEQASIVCDPGASIPCYFTRQDGVLLVFSHLERCRFLNLQRFTVNYDFLSRLLAYDRIQTGETGLKEIRELLGGQRLFVSGSTERTEQVWDPRAHAAEPLRMRPADAAATLRDMAACMARTWARQYDPTHLDLSGGFDSSALAGLLAAPGTPPVITVHQRLLSDDPFEADHARAAAAHAGLAYREIRLDPRQPLPAPDTHPRSARPQRQFIGMDLSGPRREAGLPIADACFTGQGGDHLFLADRSPLGFCDFLRHEGLNGRIGQELIDAARLSGLSVWSVLRACLPRLAGSGPSDLERSIAAHREKQGHRALRDLPGWMLRPDGLPPAKFNQVCNLMHMVQVREQFDRPWARNVVHPYISQPLMELCLRIPAYILTSGGVNRGLARQAFKGLLPETIRQRMTKGSSTSYFMDYLMTNHDAALRVLRGGALQSAGLVCDADLEAMTSRETYKISHTGRRLLVWYAVEAWLRAWRTQP